MVDSTKEKIFAAPPAQLRGRGKRNIDFCVLHAKFARKTLKKRLVRACTSVSALVLSNVASGSDAEHNTIWAVRKWRAFWRGSISCARDSRIFRTVFSTTLYGASQ